MIAIPNMDKPKECGDCNFVQAFWDDKRWLFRCLVTDKIAEDCPLIEIDNTNTELLEFFNEFKKWKASKEVTKYINAVYGERRTDE